MIKQKVSPGVLPDYVMDYVLKSLQRITFGEVILVAQDGVLVQLEWNEKRRLDHWDETLVQRPWTEKEQRCVARRVALEFAHLQFGRLVIVIKSGRVIQIERTEKQRFSGLDGEGI